MNDLISRQAAIEAIQNVKGGGSAMRKVLFLNAVKDVPTAQHWIPCSERLPEESGEYLITGLHHSGELWIEVDRFDKHGGNSPYQWWHFDEKVIAWMPLPEPYKGEES